MTALDRQLLEDRAMRDAALALFKADIRQVREDLAAKGVGARVGERVSEVAVDMADEAMELAGENKGPLAAALIALVLWLARAPLLNLLFGDDAEDDE